VRWCEVRVTASFLRIASREWGRLTPRGQQAGETRVDNWDLKLILWHSSVED
jgi:hypothetical protein